jgi:hypothetical protein
MPRRRNVYAPHHEPPPPIDWAAHFAEADRLRAEEARIVEEAMQANEALLPPSPIEAILRRLTALEEQVRTLIENNKDIP